MGTLSRRCAAGLIWLVPTLVSTQAQADDWIIARSTSSGSCHVQHWTSRPRLGESLTGKFPTRKAACERAKGLKTDDPSNRSRCFDYTTGTVSACKGDGVVLP